MSANTYLIDASTRHQIFLERYSEGRYKEAEKTLLRLKRDIRARLANEPTEFQAQRLTAIYNDIDNLLNRAYGSLANDVRGFVGDLAADEAAFTAQLGNKVATTSFSLPSEGALLAAVNTKPMKIGKRNDVKLEEALSEFGEKKAKQVRQIVRDGVVLGDTTEEVARKVSQNIDNIQRKHARTLVKTITNHISATAKEETYKANSDVLDGYEWVSTLDSRTTVVCGSRDGEIYETGVGPIPPAHWGCRSVTIPAVKDEFTAASGLTGDRPAIGADGVESVSGKSTYSGWLRKQPAEFIDEALGPERGKLFRQGKLKLSQFVDPTGRQYTLEQLRQMNPMAFM